METADAAEAEDEAAAEGEEEASEAVAAEEAAVDAEDTEDAEDAEAVDADEAAGVAPDLRRRIFSTLKKGDFVSIAKAPITSQGIAPREWRHAPTWAPDEMTETTRKDEEGDDRIWL